MTTTTRHVADHHPAPWRLPRHHADERRPIRPIHVVTVNGAVVVTVSGGQQTSRTPFLANINM